MPAAPFATFAFRISACHIVTYMVAGLSALLLLDYATHFQAEGLAGFMRPVDSPWVAAGPGLQVIRGLIFAAALYPFRRVIIDERNGWLKLWGLFLGLAIFSTAGPSPGSIEGMIYTVVPLRYQIMGLPEVILQTGAFSILLVAWYRKPHPRWNVIMGVAVFLCILMSMAGVLVSAG